MPEPAWMARIFLGTSLFCALILAAACQSIAPVSATQLPTATLAPRQLARLEPASGVYFGVNLDFATDSTAAFAQRIGRPAAVYVAFAHFPIADDESATLDQFVDQVRRQGAMALLTLEPSIALNDVSPQLATDLADRLAAYNRSGVPVMVRYAHEMNGSWYTWSQHPRAYIQAFRTVAAAVHERAPESAMLWAPNYGAGYPFVGGAYQAAAGSLDSDALDTNHDGVFDGLDDPYAPYYPGDDAVDWVGMTLYHWGDQWPWGKNVVPEDGKFAAQLTGTYNGAGGDQRDVPDFYHVYAEGHGKPLAIPETAAFYNTTVGGDSELQVKQAWWHQVFSPVLLQRFPYLKMINWFEWRKPEAEVQDAIVDWSATLDPIVRAAFLADLPRDRLRFGSAIAPQNITLEAPVPTQVATTPEETSEAPPPDALMFAGIAWHARAADDLEGPGPNYFASTPEHVWVDDTGRLHLRVSPGPDGRWYAAEVVSDQPMGYGRYRFTVDTPLDNLDPNVVLGLFTWDDDPAENHREMDIEFARFGDPGALAGRYTRQPYTDPANVALFAEESAPLTSHALNWTPGQVAFASWAGDATAPPSDESSIASRIFRGDVPEPGNAHVHINVWLDAGRPPTDGQPIELIIENFSFVPS
jgi:glycosyl hydrolase family 26